MFTGFLFSNPIRWVFVIVLFVVWSWHFIVIDRLDDYGWTGVYNFEANLVVNLSFFFLHTNPRPYSHTGLLGTFSLQFYKRKFRQQTQCKIIILLRWEAKQTANQAIENGNNVLPIGYGKQHQFCSMLVELLTLD